ncbi:MAG: hypothetical protein JRG89_22800 [Deltaproteobacteria bacterium]|nr:hypothetical protein [Deltaproteobacteria bacterium]
MGLASMYALRSPLGMAIVEDLQKSTEGLFPGVLGIRFLSFTPDEIRAEMDVTPATTTTESHIAGRAEWAAHGSRPITASRVREMRCPGRQCVIVSTSRTH